MPTRTVGGRLPDRAAVGTPLVTAAVLVTFLAAGGARPAGAQEADRPFSYADYAEILKAHVDDEGMISYRELKAKRRRLDSFVAAMGGLEREVFDKWNEERKIAFWINAYNAFTLAAIIDHYPIRASGLSAWRFPKNSIRQIPGVWKKLQFVVKGRKTTLDAIEHSVLRERFNEPRIHVALVCAAIGCPPLRKEPYVAKRLDKQLDDQARKFLGDPGKFRIDRQAGRVHLSPIFKWFGGDFVETYGTDQKFKRHGKAERAVLNFASRYLGDEDKKYLAEGKYSISYLDYDWTLNEQEPPKGSSVKKRLVGALEWIDEFGFWGFLVFGAVYVLACVLMVPGTILTFGAALLFGLVWGMVAVSISSTAGACLAFLVGRTLARGWIARKVEGNRKFKAIDEAVGREGFKIVLLTRLSPVFPFNLLNYAYGLTKVSFLKYALASWIGMLPGTVMYVYIGSALRSFADLAGDEKVETGVSGKIFFWAGLVVAVVVAAFVARLARKAMKGVVAPTGTDAIAEAASARRRPDGTKGGSQV